MEKNKYNNPGRPKWTFILYLAIHRKLYTKDRLEKWGICRDMVCSLYCKKQENH